MSTPRRRIDPAPAAIGELAFIEDLSSN